MTEKIIGQILLWVGILIMGVSIYLFYEVLTNKIKPFEVFSVSSASTPQQKPAFNIQNLLADPSSIQQMQSQIVTQVIEGQINKTMNIGLTVFLWYLIMLFGYRLSSLGVQLMRPIQVKLRAQDGTTVNIPPKPPKEG